MNKTFTAGEWVIEIELYAGGKSAEPTPGAIGVAAMRGGMGSGQRHPRPYRHLTRLWRSGSADIAVPKWRNRENPVYHAIDAAKLPAGCVLGYNLVRAGIVSIPGAHLVTDALPMD